MITSAGGCCDCGDPEAWTDGVHCSLHQPKENLPPKEVNESPLSNLPNVILTRAPVVFRTLLQYCQVVLYWLSEDSELPQGLKTGSTATLLEKDSYHTLLYNDEVHSYDEVIYTLTENLGLGHVEAIGLTTSVDQVGRSLVMSGTKQECEDAKKKVNTNLGKPLQVMVLHSTVVAHQKCALQVLEYLEKLAHQSAGLCRLLSVALLSETEEGHSILDTYFLRDSDTWKGSASRWQSLILHSIFIDLKMKEDLGIALTRNYNVLLKNFNREQQVRDVSATALSVQLFTTPSLTRVLIVEHDLLSVLFGTIEDFFQSCVSDRGQLIFRGKPDVAIRIAYCTHDLRYVLRTQPPAESEWTPEFRDKFIRGFRMFLRLLNIMEDIDSVKRKRGRHVAREIEWEPALNMWCLLQPVVLMVVQWCQSDAKCLREAVKLTKEMCLQSNTMKFTKTEPFLVEYFVGEDPVSIHCPLPRLLAGLLTAAGKHNLQLSELLDLSEGDPEMVKNNLLKIMEKSLRCLVYCGQVHAGMWKRNGYSVLNQVFNYQYHFCQSGMYDKDLVMIKSAAALLEPYIFLHALIHKYRLTRWLEGSEDPVDGRDEPVDDAICYLTAEAEELVYLLIIVLGEHYFPGVGQVEMSHCLRRELIHTLYISPYSHNDLIKHHKHHEEKDLTPLLREVAEYERGSQSRKGMYKLKQEFEKEHTLFFYHYTRVDQSKAEDIQRRKVKSAGGPSKLGAVPPPVPPPLCEPYKGILRLIHSPVLWKILMQVFKRAISNSKLWSDKLLNESLYLCGIMLLQEEASGVSHFSTNAIEPFGSEEVSMLQVLEKLLTSQKAEEHRPLLTWIIQKLLAVQQSYMGTPVDAEDDTDDAKPKLPEVKSAPKQRSSVAAEKRKKIMEQMAKQQKNFLQKHKNELENIVSSPTSSSPRLSASVSNEGGVLCVVGLEALRHPPVNPPPFTCNICQGEGLEDHSSAPGTPILGAWVQRSAVMKRNVPEGGEVEDTNFLSCTLDKSLGIFANSCGHTMHYDCWKK
jgi:E3 ubiquitin-protein ligase UBR2